MVLFAPQQIHMPHHVMPPMDHCDPCNVFIGTVSNKNHSIEHEICGFKIMNHQFDLLPRRFVYKIDNSYIIKLITDN